MILDIVVLAALLVSCVIAFFRGFIREILTILGVLGGTLAALFLGPHLSPTVLGWFGSKESDERLFGFIPYELAADIIAYGLVFLIVVIILSVISHYLAKGAKAAGLGALDRSFGVLFGIARAAVFLALMYLPAYTLVEKEQRDEWFQGSKTHFYVEALAGWMAALLPQSVSDDIEKQAEQAADIMARETREKLQEIDVLNRDNLEEELKKKLEEQNRQQQNSGRASGPGSGGGQPGYKQDQRRDLNRLIEDGLNE